MSRIEGCKNGCTAGCVFQSYVGDGQITPGDQARNAELVEAFVQFAGACPQWDTIASQHPDLTTAAVKLTKHRARETDRGKRSGKLIG